MTDIERVDIEEPVDDKEEMNEEPKEEPTEEPIEEPKEEIEEVKPIKEKKKRRPPLPPEQRTEYDEIVQCPDCKLRMKRRNLMYNHKPKCRYLKFKDTVKQRMEEETRIKQQEEQRLKLEATPQISTREIQQTVEQFNRREEIISQPQPVIDEQQVLRNYMNRLKQEEKQRKDEKIKSLFSNILTRRK